MIFFKRAAASVAVLVLTSCAGSGGSILAPGLAHTGLPPSFHIEKVPFFPQTAHHCGPAALATVLVFSGVATEPDTLAPMVYVPGRRGTLAVEMAAAARRHGRMPYLLDGTLESLTAELVGGRPVTVLLNLGAASLPRWHYAVVIGYDGSRDEFLLRSGQEREKQMAARRFKRYWQAAEFWAMVVLTPGRMPATARKVPYFRQAAALESAGRLREAEAAWRPAVLLWPESSIPQLGLGNALAAQGRLEEAEEVFRGLLAGDPANLWGQNNLAHVLSLRGCHQEALRLIGGALRRASRTEFEEMITETGREIRERSAKDGGDGGCSR